MMGEFLFYWLALATYVASSLGYISGLAFNKPNHKKIGRLLAITGLTLHSLALGIRWYQVGHGPYISTYEILSSTAGMAVLLFVLLEWRQRNFANLGALTLPLAFLMMGFALLGSREAKSLPPTLQSAWLVVHVVFAKLAVASLLVAVAMAVFFLLKQAKETRASKNFLARLPSTAVLDDHGYRLVVFGFICLTVMIISGAIWANNSWGQYWSWDSAQTWSLVVWLVYGLFLHGRITFHWQGTISAWYVIVAFFFSLVAFFVLPYFIKGLHSQYMVG
ncbi:MAG: c-type cytochrome biogenesis protein CcsB [Proteobacteria bacterium]|nr:c-type cytochrome biogenesis protein CcsB [Pseudomonadota bacterium]